MPVLPVLLYPAPELRRVSAPLASFDGAAARLAADLVETVASFPGCVGIAAPQTGHAFRMIAVDASRYRKPVPNQGSIVLANPAILSRDGDQLFREGCLSLPEYTANVTRAAAVTVEGVAPNGELVRLSAEGFEAVVLQHEIDHLDGILFIDRVSSLKRDVFKRKVREVRDRP